MELSTFKEDIKTELKRELEDFSWDINRKLTDTAKELATHTERIEAAETRLCEMESWNMEANDALLQSLKQQRVLQDKLTDQEGRNRQNNVRIFGLKEGVEGSSVTEYIEHLLKQELSLPADTDLQIQRAHRALVPKPGSDKPARSVVVNFLQYTVKERILKEAWKKRIQHQGRALYFNHDYATEITQKRKEYIGIKKALKERGIIFQTPLSKMRIHWESGPRMYKTAQEAASELNRREVEVETPGNNTTVTGLEERLRGSLPWQRVGNTEDASVRAKQKLPEFQRRSGH